MEIYPKIIAVDFDGTIVENKYPEIGDFKLEVVDKLLEEQKQGTLLILWTCRDGAELDAAILYCHLKGLIFDSINKNVPHIIEKFGFDTRKVFANEYWDDKAVTIS
jgi:hydroxymethylpyrimidine pyrophosphatase-like HAD family hydrolase